MKIMIAVLAVVALSGCAAIQPISDSVTYRDGNVDVIVGNSNGLCNASTDYKRRNYCVFSVQDILTSLSQ